MKRVYGLRFDPNFGVQPVTEKNFSLGLTGRENACSFDFYQELFTTDLLLWH